MTPKPKHRRLRNNPFLEKAVVGLWMAREALTQYLELHQDGGELAPEDVPCPPEEPATTYPHCLGCECFVCNDCRGIVYMLQTCETRLEGTIVAPIKGKLRALRAAGFPFADQLADMVLSHRDAQDDMDDDEMEAI